MHKMSRPLSISLNLSCALVFALSLNACAKKHDAHDAAGGHADSGPVAKWTYDGDTGPDHWASLGGGSSVCGTGQRQSPVDISGQVKSQTGKVRLNYNSASATIQNTGKTVRIVPQNGGGLVLDGDQYDLKAIEFHSPSEHAINGHHSTLESQFIHEDKQGHKVIVAVLYDIGVADPMLASLWTYLPSDPGQPVPMSDLLINAQDLLPGTEDFYVYAGSLTTPPCTEGVTWMIYSSPLSISAEQADAFSRLIGPNARPIQPQHDRSYFHLTGY
ncbi:MAG: carbonic anhydrase [Asticcacaulis sp.]|jgi:carbonic anhydrase|uniref:carbonic anhydrase n=1 Tax=Asticcacaulis sp. TaxID=1872648 RepID=UPI003F7C67FF